MQSGSEAGDAAACLSPGGDRALVRAERVPEARPVAEPSSLAGALSVAQQIGGPTGSHVADAAREAFIQGVSKGLLVAIVAAAAGALLALRYLPARNTESERARESAIAVAVAT